MRTTSYSYTCRGLMLVGLLIFTFIFLMGTTVFAHETGGVAGTTTDETSEIDEESDNQGPRVRPRPVPFGEVRSPDGDSDASSSPRLRLQDKREDLKQTREDIRERFSGPQRRLEQHVKGRFQGIMFLIGARFDAAITRLERVADRIDSRTTALTEDGLGLSEASTLVENARTHLEEAGDFLEIALADLELALESDTPREEFALIRETLHDAKEVLRSARDDLREAISLIREAVTEGLGIEALEEENEVPKNDKDEDDVTEDAEEAIADAEEEIVKAQERINKETEKGSDTTEAQDLLEQAITKLSEAKEAFDNEHYGLAEELAEESRDLANESREGKHFDEEDEDEDEDD